MKLSDRIQHFFHIVSNIHPIVWIVWYVCLTPVFATIYWALPEDQFRSPDLASTDWGSWLYYSIVTITTLGFGDYTPAHGWAQAITAIEVMCGLIFLGFFLNAVGSLKSEIDVESEVEKQRRLHFNLENDKLMKSIPGMIHQLNIFLSYCYAVTTPIDKRNETDTDYNPDFTFNDLRDLFKPSGLPADHTDFPAVTRLVRSAAQTSLALDSLQTRLDLTLWPDILEDCFSFVANCQLFANTDVMFGNPSHIVLNDNTNTVKAEEAISDKIKNWKDGVSLNDDPDLVPVAELFHFIKENAKVAMNLEKRLAELGIRNNNEN